MPARRTQTPSQEPNFVEEVIEERGGRQRTKRFDKTRFPSALKAERYENYYHEHSIVYERDVVIDDFAKIGLKEDMERRE